MKGCLRLESVAGHEGSRDPQNWDTMQSKRCKPDLPTFQREVRWESARCRKGLPGVSDRLGTEPLCVATLLFA